MTNTTPPLPYYLGQMSSDGRKIIELREGKVCVEDMSAAHVRGLNNRKWYKESSPILNRIFGGY